MADDHEWILQILTQVVRDTLPAAEVVPVEDGQQALDQYRQGGCDFLVTNHQMPHMDGLALTRHVRAEAPGLPIVMVSVKSSVKPEALAAGADWFLAKEQIMEGLPPLLLAHTGGPAQN
ncbi:MAG: response regulator [Gluconacetobacter diazotrophicus]|nr:response regulator [Gluconacetobacter diazotrophicus]